MLSKQANKLVDTFFSTRYNIFWQFTLWVVSFSSEQELKRNAVWIRSSPRYCIADNALHLCHWITHSGRRRAADEAKPGDVPFTVCSNLSVGRILMTVKHAFNVELTVCFGLLCPKALTWKWVLYFFVRKDTKQWKKASELSHFFSVLQCFAE